MHNYVPRSVSLKICTLIIVFLTSAAYLTSAYAQSEAPLSEQQNFEKKLLNKVLHPLLCVPSRQEMDKRLLPLRNRISKISFDNTPIASFEVSKNSRCYPEIFSELNSQQKSGVRGVQDKVHFLSGILYELCGNLEHAKKEYESTLRLRRRNPDALFRYAVLSLKINRHDPLRSVLEEALWRDFSQKYLINYLIGLNLNAQSKQEEALPFFEKSLKENPSFATAAIESYHIIRSQRRKVSSPAELATIDQKLYSNLATINRLGAANRDMALEYIRHLLLSGDPLSSPHKLSEGNQLAGKWLRTSKGTDDDMLLMKIQFLEKLGKSEEAYSALIERESKGELTDALKAKKTFFEEEEKVTKSSS